MPDHQIAINLLKHKQQAYGLKLGLFAWKALVIDGT